MSAPFIRIFVAISVALLGRANAADCPRKDALGTSRILNVDAKTYPRVGLKSFPQSLPLAEKEVVLTFDDGPFPGTTPKILDALAVECVKATFFLIGRNAASNPAIVKRIAAEGHTIGHHTWSHQTLSRIGEVKALAEIDHGIEADMTALGHDKETSKDGLFFRFPGFASTPALLDALQARGAVVFGADLWASDWNVMTPQQELRLLIGRLESSRKGIVLLHDTKRQTAAMLPAFLQYLRKNGYKIVSVVPAKAS